MGPVCCRWAESRSLHGNKGKEAINLGVRKFKGLSNQHKERIKDCVDRKSEKERSNKEGYDEALNVSHNINENKTA